ncbi:hypothetical protein AX774_g2131 [Zancudomyces culisetae]|uniref:Uncharacterized protein n=1 Tax=Zancudomyces culisetae TaxID=1213189 RepID=A0A1R1PTY1_ZANCU|nr:hypothetical protein AX774_g2131 [Zancudomyces culisetae]|eukprot:OMH84352.1 hypothetical protein AX774_g2131 [Zancudomyces culisetae]
MLSTLSPFSRNTSGPANLCNTFSSSLTTLSPIFSSAIVCKNDSPSSPPSSPNIFAEPAGAILPCQIPTSLSAFPWHLAVTTSLMSSTLSSLLRLLLLLPALYISLPPYHYPSCHQFALPPPLSFALFPPNPKLHPTGLPYHLGAFLSVNALFGYPFHSTATTLRPSNTMTSTTLLDYAQQAFVMAHLHYVDPTTESPDCCHRSNS